jgi:uncharacterized protein
VVEPNKEKHMKEHMRDLIKYFGGSFAFTIAALIAAFFVGYSFSGNLVEAGLAAVFTTLMLGILETSLSFDNAVVNAKIIERMSPFWRKLFLTVGILIAVFGMRLVFPVVIVWAVSGKAFLDVLALTISNPKEFQDILIAQHIVIAGFGGAFLWMVFTKYFFDAEKEVHWVIWFEEQLAKLGAKVEHLPVFVTLAAILTFSVWIPADHLAGFILSAIFGIMTNIAVEGLSGFLESTGEKKAVSNTSKVAAAGLGTFIYLEFLDASFSFDGVIGAFAITNNLYLIALGLGIGAMFVRSFTIKLVDSKTLSTFKYLEHGAFWAIGALSIIMYLSATGVEVPEVVSGLVGIGFIAISFISSVLSNKKQPEEVENA